MKSIIIVFALIIAASCDVSEISCGDGCYKDENGYHYNTPEARLDIIEENVDVPAPEEPVVVEEVVAVTEAAQPVVEDEIVEVVDEYLPPKDYLPPNNDLKEYLPPKSEEAKKKRQIPVRKVYRRFVRRH